jgi:Skp family chaperone for outer membrane proteins
MGRPTPASKIAVLDLAEVLRQYKKSDDLLEDVKSQFATEKAKIDQWVGQGQELEKSLLDGSLDKDSDEFAERQKKVIQLSAKVKTFKSVKEKELKLGQARALLGIYNEVVSVVRQVAEQNGYTLVLRIDREAEAAKSFQTITQTLNESVLRHDPRDDITDVVIAQLNRQYEKAGGSAASGRAPGSAGAKDTTSGAKTGPPQAGPAPTRKTPAR